MVLSDDRRVLDAVRDLREYDGKLAAVPRLSAKLTEMQAAVGRVQLKRLPSFLAARRRWAALAPLRCALEQRCRNRRHERRGLLLG